MNLRLVQMKLVTGAVLVGIQRYHESKGHTLLVAPCSMVYHSSDGSWDLRYVLDPVQPVLVNNQTVAIIQEVREGSETEKMYVEFLTSWAAMMFVENESLPPEVDELFRCKDEEFRNSHDGIPPLLYGKHAYFKGTGHKDFLGVHQEVQKYLKESQIASDIGKVVRVDFQGSNT